MVGIYFVWTCFLGCFHCWDSRFSLGKHAVPLGAAEQKLEQEQEQQDKTMRQKQLDGNNKTKVRRQNNNTKATRATRTTTTATTTTTTTPARRYGSVKQMINTNFQGENDDWLQFRVQETRSMGSFGENMINNWIIYLTFLMHENHDWIRKLHKLRWFSHDSHGQPQLQGASCECGQF